MVGPKDSELEFPWILKELPGTPGPLIQKVFSFRKYVSQFSKAILRLIKKYNPQLLVFTTADGLLNLFAMPRLSVPSIMVLHSLIASLKASIIKRMFFKLFIANKFKQTKAVFFVTTAINTYQKLFGNIPIFWTPFPTGVTEEDLVDFAPANDSPNKQPWISYLGAARPEKGFCEIFNLVKKAPENYHFLIQYNILPNYRNEPQTKKYLEKLKGMSRKNLILIKGPLPKERYLECIQNSSIILLLYKREYYQYSISGILLEAFAFGKPVITTSGTWLAEQVQKYGGGIILDEVSPERILNAIDKILENYSKFRQEAINAGIKLQQIYNARSFVKRIIEVVEEET